MPQAPSEPPLATFERYPSRAMRAALVTLLMISIPASVALSLLLLAGWNQARAHLPFVTWVPAMILGVVFALPLFLALAAANRWLALRFGRADVGAHYVRFSASLFPGRQDQRAWVDRRELQVVDISPAGLLCRSPHESFLRGYLTPLFIPTENDEQQARALEVLVVDVPAGDPVPHPSATQGMSRFEVAIVLLILGLLGWQLLPLLYL